MYFVSPSILHTSLSLRSVLPPQLNAGGASPTIIKDFALLHRLYFAKRLEYWRSMQKLNFEVTVFVTAGRARSHLVA